MAGNPKYRGAVLLEVLLSIAILVFGLAVVGLQVNKGLDAARAAEVGTKGVLLAETKFAELNAGVIKPENNNDEIKGDFGLVYPGYTWRFQFKPTEINDFLMVTLQIGFSAKQAKAQMSNPDQDLQFDDDDVRVVETAYRLMPIPADVNFERDFGFTQEDLEKAQQQADQADAAGNAGGNGGGAAAGGMNMAQILALLGPLLSGGSFDPRMLSSIPPEQMAQIQPMLEMMLGRGNVKAKGPLDNMFQQAFGGRGRGGRGGRGGQGQGGNGNGNGDNQQGNAGNANGNNGNDGGGSGGRGRNNGNNQNDNSNNAGSGSNQNDNGGNGNQDDNNGGNRGGRRRNNNNNNNNNNSDNSNNSGGGQNGGGRSGGNRGQNQNNSNRGGGRRANSGA